MSKHTKIDTLFDLGSQVNLIFEALVKRMDLETKPHSKPYPLGWVCDKEKFNVTKQCRVRFVICWHQAKVERKRIMRKKACRSGSNS